MGFFLDSHSARDLVKWPVDFEEKAWEEWRARTNTSSPFHLEVYRMLAEMKIDAAWEFLTPGQAMSIDIALTCGAQKVALEVDGPSHFTRNSPHRNLGHTEFRNRCLVNEGWVVVQVPGYEWVELDEEGKRTFLRNLLATTTRTTGSERISGN